MLPRFRGISRLVIDEFSSVRARGGLEGEREEKKRQADAERKRMEDHVRSKHKETAVLASPSGEFTV